MVSRVVRGKRIGKLGVLRPSCIATIFDPTGEKILLTRRSDNGVWCLPGGGMDAGESAAEACAREVLEETGLVVRVDRLIGVYSDPNLIIEYPGGNRVQPLSLNFAAVAVGGELTITAETTEVGYFSQKAMKSLEIWDHHVERIADAFAGCSTTFVR